jgi:hypothetical protein
MGPGPPSFVGCLACGSNTRLRHPASFAPRKRGALFRRSFVRRSALPHVRRSGCFFTVDLRRALEPREQERPLQTALQPRMKRGKVCGFLPRRYHLAASRTPLRPLGEELPDPIIVPSLVTCYDTLVLLYDYLSNHVGLGTQSPANPKRKGPGSAPVPSLCHFCPIKLAGCFPLIPLGPVHSP